MATAVAVGGHGLRLRAPALAIRTADEAPRDLVDGVRWLSGAAAPLLAPELLAAGGLLLAGERVLGRDPAADLQRLLTDHPGLVDDMVGALPGFISSVDLAAGASPAAAALMAVTGLTPFPLTVAEGAGLVDNLLDRLLMGEVTDYVNVTPRFTFNLADVFLLAGMVLAIAGIAMALGVQEGTVRRTPEA